MSRRLVRWRKVLGSPDILDNFGNIVQSGTGCNGSRDKLMGCFPANAKGEGRTQRWSEKNGYSTGIASRVNGTRAMSHAKIEGVLRALK